jgi:hypothetical protein
MWKRLESSRISKSRVFHVFIVDGKNEFWYDDSLFAGWHILFCDETSNLNILEIRKYHVTFRQETDTLMFCKVGQKIDAVH